MIQCRECEYFFSDEMGITGCSCNPFQNVKELECLTKLQLMKLNDMNIKLDRMTRAYESTLAIYRKLAPMQEKMFRHVEREIDEVEEADSWKRGYDDNDDEDDPFSAPY